MQSLNKGVNPFKPNEPQNIMNSINENNNNIESNDNIETNESSFKPFITINMKNNDKNISSPFANIPKKEAFFLDNIKANEISVNPISTSDNKNPFFTQTDNNKGKTDGEIKSGLFAGLNLINDNKTDSQNLNAEKKTKSTPIFPGGININEEKNKKTNLFVDEDQKKDNKEKENIVFSDIISEEFPKTNFDENKNKSKNKKEDSNIKNSNKNIQESILPNASSLFASKEDFNDNNKEQEEVKEKEKENEINIEINVDNNNQKESMNDNQGKSSENKENENPEEKNELIMSNIINSNLFNENINNINNDVNKIQQNNSNFSKAFNDFDKNENKIQEEPKNKRKSLFGDFFNNNKLEKENILKNPKISSAICNDNNKNENLFLIPDKDKNKESQNMFGNNGGKSILNENPNMSNIFNTSPIKSSNLFKKENEENKDKDKNKINNNKEKDDEYSDDIKPENGNDEEEKEKQKEENPIINIHNDNNIIKINKDNDEKIFLYKPETKFGEENDEEALSDYEEESIPNIPKEEEININISKQKPLNKIIYTNMIKKIYRITEKKKNDIEIPEKKTITLYDNALNQFLKDFEEKIINLKKGYVEALVKKHFEKLPSKKREIVNLINLPKRRNELKKTYREMIELINKKLEKENQKYYYMLILEILKKYEIIQSQEINNEHKILAQKYKNKLEKKNKKKGKNYWNYFSSSLFLIIIPTFFITYYLMSNAK